MILTLHPDAEWRTAAEHALEELQTLFHVLNTDVELYSALKSAYERDASNTAAPIATAALDLLRDFEHGGVHLRDAQDIVQLKSHIDRVGAQYAEGGGRDALVALLEARAVLAERLGEPSYAQHVLRRTIARDVNGASEYLYEYLRETSDSQAPASMDAVGQLPSFFTVQSCIDALGHLTHKLFGLELRPMSVERNALWHPSVRKFGLHAATAGGGLDGVVYLDLQARAGKPSGACTLPLHVSRRLDWGDGTPAAREPVLRTADGTHSLPFACLTMSLPRADRLAFADVEVLFHEWGHLLSIIVSRTHAQHTSGTRMAIDLAEVPATMMESFARDYRVVAPFATHAGTGVRLDEQMFARAMRQHAHAEIEGHRLSALQAVVDLRLHGEDFDGTDGIERALREGVRSAQRVCKLSAADLRVADGRWLAHFPHFATYGAQYYSYTLARSLGRRVYHSLFAADPFDARSGEKLSSAMLRVGSEREPHDVVRAVLGSDQDHDPRAHAAREPTI